MINDALLMELANRWESDAVLSEKANPNSQIAIGDRQAKRECADAIRMLLSLFGDKPPQPQGVKNG